MSDHPHHEHLIQELEGEFKTLFSNSPQGIYVYLDDTHKTCNKKFADMLGYTSPEEWIKNEFPISDVVEEDQDKGIEAYMNASQNFTASTFHGTWIRKDGKKIHTEVTMVPFTYKGEVFVLHFISEK